MCHHVLLCSDLSHRCSLLSPVKSWLKGREMKLGVGAMPEPVVGQCSATFLNSSEVSSTRMSRKLVSSKVVDASFASEFSALDVTNASAAEREDDASDVAVDNLQQHVVLAVDNGTLEEGQKQTARKRREFCKSCCKAASLCICSRMQCVVNNKTEIIILQHPLEKTHHLGSARIAVLGLRNVDLISIPEDDEQVSYRLRPKIPGSKRAINGRGGKKQQYLIMGGKKGQVSSKRPGGPKHPLEDTLHDKGELAIVSLPSNGEATLTRPESCETTGLGSLTVRIGADEMVGSSSIPSWIKLLPDVGLLFPSEQAFDLRPVSSEPTSSSASLPTSGSAPMQGECRSSSNSEAVIRKPPSQLIVLDGTWSKAKRMFYENPWLHSIPHYRLPLTDLPSRYGWVRRQPKPGCMSTVESIVFALQVLEPETAGLESLLDVFDSMIDDQKRCMGDKFQVMEDRFKRGP